MRKVNFKKWIANDRKYSEFLSGLFHSWGVCAIEMTSSVASYSVALVEDNEGIVHEVLPSNIQFIDLPL